MTSYRVIETITGNSPTGETVDITYLKSGDGLAAIHAVATCLEMGADKANSEQWGYTLNSVTVTIVDDDETETVA